VVAAEDSERKSDDTKVFPRIESRTARWREHEGIAMLTDVQRCQILEMVKIYFPRLVEGMMVEFSLSGNVRCGQVQLC